MAKRSDTPKFESEAALVAAFCAWLERENANRNRGDDRKWTAYHETAGWDLLLVNRLTGSQIGIEAKLSLNAKVLAQALPCPYAERGPDFRAVLVPRADLQGCLAPIARHMGITVIVADWTPSYQRVGEGVWRFSPDMPDEANSAFMREWPLWLPAKRCTLPEYVPDVVGGKASPVALTLWKIQAIKLMILLDRRGYVTRGDMRLLKLSESRWTAWNGFLDPDRARGGYVRGEHTPDLKAQHPTNYAQIEADFAKWGAGFDVTPAPAQGALFGGAAA